MHFYGLISMSRRLLFRVHFCANIFIITTQYYVYSLVGSLQTNYSMEKKRITDKNIN